MIDDINTKVCATSNLYVNVKQIRSSEFSLNSLFHKIVVRPRALRDEKKITVLRTTIVPGALAYLAQTLATKVTLPRSYHPREQNERALRRLNIFHESNTCISYFPRDRGALRPTKSHRLTPYNVQLCLPLRAPSHVQTLDPQ